MGALQSLVLAAQRVAAEHGGVLDRVNVDERGVFLIMFFGLPVRQRWVPDSALLQVCPEDVRLPLGHSGSHRHGRRLAVACHQAAHTSVSPT